MGNTSNTSSDQKSQPQSGQSQGKPQSPSQSSPGQQKPSSPNQNPGGGKPASDRDSKRSAQVSPDNIRDVGQGEDALGDESGTETKSPGASERKRSDTDRSQTR